MIHSEDYERESKKDSIYLQESLTDLEMEINKPEFAIIEYKTIKTIKHETDNIFTRLIGGIFNKQAS